MCGSVYEECECNFITYNFVGVQLFSKYSPVTSIQRKSGHYADTDINIPFLHTVILKTVSRTWELLGLLEKHVRLGTLHGKVFWHFQLRFREDAHEN